MAPLTQQQSSRRFQMIAPAAPIPSALRRFCLFVAAVFFAAAASDSLGATLCTWNGERHVAVANFVADKHLIIKNDILETIPVTDLLQLQFNATVPPLTVGSGVAVWLENGTRFSVTSVVSEETRLKFDSPMAGAGTVELDRVRALTFHKSASEGAFASEFAAYLKKPPRHDLLLISGAAQTMTLEGVFLKLDDQSVTFKWKDAEQTVARDRVHAIILAPVRHFNDERSGFVAALGNDGSVVEGKLVALDANTAVLEVPGIGRLTIETAGLHAIDFVSGRAVAVSSLDPAQVAETPYFDHVFHWRRDQSVGGKPLSIGGVRFANGLGVHSRCVLTYDIAKQYRRLSGFIGIDDEVGKLGDAIFKVIADGREIFNSGNVKGGQPPRRILLDVTGVQSLALEVDYGADMDVGDHADWANLRLIK